MFDNSMGKVKINTVDLMEGMPFALKFFDDDNNIYVAPSVFSEIQNGKQELRYVVMSWRTSQITIENAVKDIIQRIEAYGKETGQLE